jgi:hypothetical protein
VVRGAPRDEVGEARVATRVRLPGVPVQHDQQRRPPQRGQRDAVRAGIATGGGGQVVG